MIHRTGIGGRQDLINKTNAFNAKATRLRRCIMSMCGMLVVEVCKAGEVARFLRVEV